MLVLFCVCVLLGAAILHKLETGPMPAESDQVIKKADPAPAPADPPNAGKPEEAGKPADPGKPSDAGKAADAGKSAEEPVPVVPPEGSPPEPPTTTVTDADLNYLASRDLLIPVAHVTAKQLRDTFNQARSEGRRHDAIDIMAAQGTPVVAVSDGTVVKLFLSERGGITLYELDPSRRFVYYYAHLMSYAEGIIEGRQLRRGDVIGYVGDTGNAGAGKYHLHFAISKLTSQRWSGGDPINPYPLLVRY